MPRRTKIVATLGPATDEPAVLEAVLAAGVDVVRLNFSHGRPEDHRRRAEAARVAAERLGRDVGVLADLQGPKIRIEGFRGGGAVVLEEGARFALDAALAPDAGGADAVGIAYPDLARDVRPGDWLLLDDGRLELEVEAVADPRVVCRVRVGGELGPRKGINRLGGGLSAPALTDKDRADIVTAAELEADYLAVSFVRSAADVLGARRLLAAAGGRGGIVAKIERAEAVAALDAIVEAADAVMIARGDLAVEIGDAELPGVQKRIARSAHHHNRICITATQMMESMVQNPTPTRAEVLDVANAVLDGSDAVMLSAETASGRWPVKVVEAMARVCEGAEREPLAQRSHHRLDSHFERIDEAIAMATMYTANHLGVRAIVSFTESGATTLWLSRIRTGIPIYALMRHRDARRRVTLYRGVHPVAFDVVHAQHPNRVIEDALRVLRSRGAVADGELVIFTKGDFNGIAGGTNTMKIVRVGDPLPAVEGVL